MFNVMDYFVWAIFKLVFLVFFFLCVFFARLQQVSHLRTRQDPCRWEKCRRKWKRRCSFNKWHTDALGTYADFYFLLSLQTKAADDAPARKYWLVYFVAEVWVLTLHVWATKVLPFSPTLGVKRWEESVVTVLDTKYADVVELGCAPVIDEDVF